MTFSESCRPPTVCPVMPGATHSIEYLYAGNTRFVELKPNRLWGFGGWRSMRPTSIHDIKYQVNTALITGRKTEDYYRLTL